MSHVSPWVSTDTDLNTGMNPYTLEMPTELNFFSKIGPQKTHEEYEKEIAKLHEQAVQAHERRSEQAKNPPNPKYETALKASKTLIDRKLGEMRAIKVKLTRSENDWLTLRGEIEFERHRMQTEWGARYKEGSVKFPEFTTRTGGSGVATNIAPKPRAFGWTEEMEAWNRHHQSGK